MMPEYQNWDRRFEKLSKSLHEHAEVMKDIEKTLNKISSTLAKMEQTLTASSVIRR